MEEAGHRGSIKKLLDLLWLFVYQAAIIDDFEVHNGDFGAIDLGLMVKGAVRHV